jgi:hypothetical protein
VSWWIRRYEPRRRTLRTWPEEITYRGGTVGFGKHANLWSLAWAEAILRQLMYHAFLRW